MKKAAKRLFALLMAVLLMVTAVPVSLGDEYATLTDLPEESEPEVEPEIEPDAEPETVISTEEKPAEDIPDVEPDAAEAFRPAVLSLTADSSVTQGAACTVEARVTNAERALLLIDGKPYPDPLTESMTDL